MSRGILIDNSEFPLTQVTIESAVSDAEFIAYLRALDTNTERAFREGRRVAFVFDARKSVTTPASQRRMMGEWMKQHDEATRATCCGFAFVMDSALVRGLLTAILWIHPLPAQHAIFGTISEARQWCRRQLTENPSVDPSVEELQH